MAQTEMDKIEYTKNTVFSQIKPATAKCEHLKPLSAYARVTTRDQKDSVHQFCNPSINFKIEIMSSCAKKQKLDNSDGAYMTPKTTLSTKVFSPDLGCFMDYSGTPTSQDDVSPFGIGDVEAPKVKCHLESFLEPSCHKEAVHSGQHFSFTVSDLCPVVSGPQLEFGDSSVEPLEGDIEGMWDIGLPILESSVCHNITIKLNTSGEQNRQLSEEGQGDIMEPIHKCQATLGGKETTLDTSYETSYETTLPLQVKVKSVVVALNHNTLSSKPAAPPVPKEHVKLTKQSSKENRETQPVKCARVPWSQREVDLERDKRKYLHSVTRHLNENPEADQDVMTELLNLMTHVADQRPGTDGRQWQHPSDLTCRNYQRRFGNVMPKMALHEWHAQNSPTHKRFSNVPKTFQRSQCL